MTTIQARPTGSIPWAATFAVAASAGLLFAIEPFAGKVLLPRLGGSPSVWNTCVMVFQTLLLAGYAYSVVLARMSDIRKGLALHTVLVVASIALWPFAVRALWLAPAAGWPPVAWVAATTVAGIGLPFALLSATSPLLQVWLARASASPLDVHRLYAASNVASVAGLIVYVAALEPFVGLRRQSVLLWIGYAGAMAIAVAVVRRTHQSPGTGHQALHDLPAPSTQHDAPGTLHRAGWLVRSFAASLCLYAVNTYIATDVASFPLLWCLPLGIFLSGFAAGFSAWAARWRVWLAWAATLAALAALGQVVWVEDSRTVWFGLLAPLLALMFLITALAAELAERRPANDRLAGYYAWIGLGGLLAGVASVVVLPWAWSSFSPASVPGVAVVFDTLRGLSPPLFAQAVPEYPAALLLAAWLLARGIVGRTAVVAAVMVVAAGLPFVPGWRHQPDGIETLFEARNFFGTSRVELDGDIHRLKHGTTLHGIQPLGPDAVQPASYYSWTSPLGRVMDRLHPQNVIAVGLGVGTVAAYGRPGDHYRFLEINPLVQRIATNPRWFSYVTAARDSGVDVSVSIGDGRLLAQALDDGRWDVIIVDAFSSDAIPVHLLSIEAVEVFRRKLSARGIVAYHVSNRFFDLHPVIAAAAERLGMWWAFQDREGLSTFDYGSKWIMLARDQESASGAGLMEAGWLRPELSPAPPPWTDDWSNVLGTMRSWRFWAKDEAD